MSGKKLSDMSMLMSAIRVEPEPIEIEMAPLPFSLFITPSLPAVLISPSEVGPEFPCTCSGLEVVSISVSGMIKGNKFATFCVLDEEAHTAFEMTAICILFGFSILA